MKKIKILVSFTLIISLTMALVVPTKAFADIGVPDIPWYIDDNYYNWLNRDGNYLGKVLTWCNDVIGLENRPQSDLWSGSGDSYVYNSSSTNYYTPISVSNQDYYYDIYNPVTNTYNTVNYTSLRYDPTYNSYYYDYEYNNYDYNAYVSYSDTYVTYNYICPEDPNQNKFFEIYFVLPDGRNSFNLTKDDLKGIVFSYDVDVYEVGQIGNTLGLWHLDGNFENVINGIISSGNGSFVDSYFDGGFSLGSDKQLTLNVDEIPNEFTIEWIQYNPSKTSGITNRLVSSSSSTYRGDNNGSSIGSMTVNFKTYEYNKNNYYYPTNDIGYNKYAITYSNGVYLYFKDGVIVSNFTLPFSIIDNSIIFKASSSKNSLGVYLAPRPEYKTLGNVFYADFYTGNSNDYLINNNFITSSFGVSNYRIQNSSGTLGYLPNTFNFSTNQYYYSTVNSFGYSFYNNNNYNVDSIIDEVRLSEGLLYTENYTPRNEPFDSGIGFVVPSNPIEQNIYMQSFVKPSVWQFGGIRNPNPVNGEAYFALDGNVVISAQQYLNGLWQEIPSAIYLNGSFHNLLGYDLTTLVYFGGNASSGSNFNVDLSTTNSYLKDIRDFLAKTFGYAAFDPNTGYVNDYGIWIPSDESATNASWWDVLLPLVYLFFVIIFLLQTVNAVFALITFLVNLIFIQPSIQGINEDFVLAFQWLRGETENPFYLFGTITCWDFMVVLFQIFFVGLAFAVIRKNVDTLNVSGLKKR